MPLDESGTPEARSKNIAELIHSGREPKEAEAIAYSVERKHHEKEKYGR